MVALRFNAQQVEPNLALEPLPTGMYPVIITASEEKPTKAGDGSYLQFEMTVQGHNEAKYNGRKVFDRLNINNKNATAVDIAYRTLSAICHVTGVLHLEDSQQLHGRPFIVIVSKREREDQPGTFSNDVKGYKDMQGNDPGFSGAAAQPAANPAWAGGVTQPQQTQQHLAPAAAQQGNPNVAPAQPQEQQPAAPWQGGGQAAPAAAAPSTPPWAART